MIMHALRIRLRWLPAPTAGRCARPVFIACKNMHRQHLFNPVTFLSDLPRR